MKRIILATIMAAALAVPGLAGAGIAHAAQVGNFTEPTSLVFVNPCNGDVVLLNGTEHVVANVTTDSSGGQHSSVVIQYHLSGIGTSGSRYMLNQTYSQVLNSTGGGTTAVTVPLNLEVVSEGVSPNYDQSVFDHITINPDGTVTSSIDTVSTSCHG